jgi:DNA-binding transcriptional MerR regulator
MRVVDELIPIGQFSALTWLSPKALRIYQAQGLLEPAKVDPPSGYRYYTPSQISVAARIALLRRAGIPLAEIAEFLRDPSPDRVAKWTTALDAEVSEKRRLLGHISRLTETNEETIVPDLNASTLRRAIPVLASLDLEATQQFYASRLGFDPLFTYPDYAIVARDGVQVHFILTDDTEVPRNLSCRIDVAGIDALYDEMRSAGVVHPSAPLCEQPWGMKEFGILDGDGNLIKFGERVTITSC